VIGNANDASNLRLNAGGLFSALSELVDHDPAAPASTMGKLLGPPREVADGVVVVSRYADCHAVLRHPEIRRSLRLAAAFGNQGTSFLGGIDPPEHTQTRRLLATAFTPRVVTDLVPRLRRTIDEHLDAFVGQTRVDLSADLARPVALAALCALIGVPDADRDLIAAWSGPLSDSADMLAPPRTRAEQRAQREMFGAFRTYLRALIDDKRTTPGDDLLSRLLTMPADDCLSEREIVANMMGLLVAGHETTVSTIGHGLLVALREPQWWELLKSGDDDALNRFVDETLRYDSPLQATPRVAGADLEIGGLRVREGTALVLLLGTANRDPDAFPEPDRFDPNREGGARHLGLGGGIHYCIGGALGRAQAVLTLRAVAERVVNPRLVVDGVSYAPGWGMRAPNRIVVDADRVLPATSLAQAAS
jgi:cytochrome P450